jgi:hypothetical protein
MGVYIENDGYALDLAIEQPHQQAKRGAMARIRPLPGIGSWFDFIRLVTRSAHCVRVADRFAAPAGPLARTARGARWRLDAEVRNQRLQLHRLAQCLLKPKAQALRQPRPQRCRFVRAILRARPCGRSLRRATARRSWFACGPWLGWGWGWGRRRVDTVLSWQAFPHFHTHGF